MSQCSLRSVHPYLPLHRRYLPLHHPLLLWLEPLPPIAIDSLLRAPKLGRTAPFKRLPHSAPIVLPPSIPATPSSSQLHPSSAPPPCDSVPTPSPSPPPHHRHSPHPNLRHRALAGASALYHRLTRMCHASARTPDFKVCIIAIASIDPFICNAL